MKTSPFMTRFKMSLEMYSLGPLDPDMRHDMYIDLSAASSASVLSTIITFILIILWRSGASTQQVAYYFPINALGLLTSGRRRFSVSLRRFFFVAARACSRLSRAQ
jgi:hypothetical protein